MRSRALAAAVAVLTVACAAGPRVSVGPDEQRVNALELLGEFNIPPLTTFDALQAARFGGVSGLTLDPSSGDLLGVCDDRKDSRVFVFRLPPGEQGAPLRVNLHAYFPLPPADGAPPAIDGEGIAMGPGGRLFIASEGIQNEEPRVPPALLEYTRNYSFVRQLAIPDKFVPAATGPITRGVRDNAAFESLTLTPDGGYLYTASEAPLAQDGPEATIQTGGLVRVIEFARRGETFEAGREFAYPIDAFGAVPFAPRRLATGLVELLSLGGSEFLALERGFAEEQGEHPRSTNRIRIFRMSLAGATDISSRDSIAGQSDIVAARKRLLLDLSTVKGLSPELATLDNFEGMTFGPPLPDGTRTLLIVSDDNFNKAQRTSFLLFRMR